MGNKDSCNYQSINFQDDSIFCTDCSGSNEYRYNKYCLNTCADYFYKGNKSEHSCLNNCDDNYKYKYITQKEKYCLLKCPNDFPYYLNNDNICLKNCPTSYPYFIYETYECRQECNDDTLFIVEELKICYNTINDIPLEYKFIINNTNIYTKNCNIYNNTQYYQYDDKFICITEKECKNKNLFFFFNYFNNNNNYCLTNCPDSDKFYISSQKICINFCPISNPYYINENFKCLSQCPQNYPYNINTTKECLKNCDDFNYYVESIKTCFVEPPSEYPLQIENTNEYVNQCREDHPYLLSNNTCVKDCKVYTKFFTSFNKCVDYCPNDQPYALKDNNKCLSICPEDLPFSTLFPNYCVKNCVNEYKYIDINKLICLTKEQCEVYSEYNCEIFIENCPENCLYCSENSMKINRCLKCNVKLNYYPAKLIGNEKYYSCFSDSNKPLNYIKINNYYEKCYETCESCFDIGSSSEHNCIKCKTGYINAPENNTNNKCVLKCDFYYYYDQFNQYSCTENKLCPSIALYKIEEKKKCISSCSLDDTYIYSYGFQCVKECPENTLFNENNNCIDIDLTKCISDTIVSNIDLLDLTDNILLDYAFSYIQDFSYTFNHITRINDRKEEYSIILYKNSSCIDEIFNDIVYFDSKECLKKIKTIYNISDLTFEVINYPRKNQTNQIQYFIYNSEDKKKIDLSICSDEEISVLFPLSSRKDINESLVLELSSMGIDAFNLEDPFFNKICITFTSDDGKDVTLSDRISYYYQNVSLCDQGCTYNGIDNITKLANCSCSVSTSSFTNDILDNPLTGEIFEMFSGININVMKCFKETLNKNIVHNIGFWNYLIINLGLIICFCLFYKNGLFIIKNYIVNKIGLFPPKKIQNKKNDNDITKNIIEIKYSNNDFLFFPKKDNSDRKLNDSLSLTKSLNFYESFYENNKVNNDLNQIKKLQNNNQLPNDNKKFDEKSVIIYSNKDKLDKKITKNNKKNKKISEFLSSMESINQELDELDFTAALKLDDRKFCSYLCDKILDNIQFINTFFVNDIYKPFIIKLFLLIFAISLYFVLNCFFYSEDYISKKFKNNNSNSFSFFINNEISKIMYASMAGIVINGLINFLFNTKKKIINIIKYEKNKMVIQSEIARILKGLEFKYKFIFLIIILLNILFWYYLCCFCYVYHNSQLDWFKGSIITIIIIQIFSFIFTFIITSLRFLGLKFKIEFFFKISQMLND